ncbi:MAG: flagellar basal body rod protein FlgC [Alphaproteobacteria bacterium]|nr:flagellar basal body rod protein FlgC [Alphaproteobacteria bacterium]
MSELMKTVKISSSGLRAQSERMRVLSENIANASSAPISPNADPYRRKTITFANVLDKTIDARTVRVKRIGSDQGDFPRRFEPGHPAADAAGYVKYPNVNSLIEAMDLREATRSYEANLAVIENAKAMMNRTIDMLRN